MFSSPILLETILTATCDRSGHSVALNLVICPYFYHCQDAEHLSTVHNWNSD